MRLHIVIVAAAMLVVAVLTGSPAAAEDALVQRWDSHADFEACYRDRYLDSESEQGSVKLTRGVVVADEMGKGYNDFQPIHGKTQAKKVLVVEDPDVTEATLMLGGSVIGCDIVVNGKVLGGEPLERSYWHADFERYVIPPELLKAGENEFVFRARDEKSGGQIRIENCQQPNRSAASRDGGHTWDFDHLAEDGYCNGELQVRLNLGRHGPSAWLKSPVIDLAAAHRPRGLPAATPARVTALEADIDAPEGTAAALFIRSGPTPDGYEENWSPWRAVGAPADAAAVEPARFVQWKVELTTDAAQKTPIVKAVELRLEPSDAPASAIKAAEVVEDANQRIVRSSYDFAYADYDKNSRLLRDHFDLASIVEGKSSDFERLATLRQWVREQWKDGWDWGPLQYIPSWDARVLLTMAPQNLSLGMCTHYATTYVQTSVALGYTSRSIFRGHALSESWSNEHGKWIVMDAGMDPDDKRRATYHFERTGAPGIPLNELEVRRAYWIDKDWQDIRLAATNMSGGEVAEAFGADVEHVLKNMETMFLPLRNNFVDHREPEEPEHGQGYFKYLGHLYWKDPSTPDVPWTDFFTTRQADLYWTLNQAEIFLREPEAGGATMPVMLDTVTPNFAGYEVRIDGGEWRAWTADGKGELAARPLPMKRITGGCVELDWPLHAGRNTIEVRPINKAGHRGIVSRMTLEVEM